MIGLADPARARRPASGRVSVAYTNSRSVLTPASGFMSRYKFTLNPYAGCAFGCEYCYARFFAPSAGQREAWGRWVVVKRNAAGLVARACQRGALRTGDAVYMSSVTDPYQPVEARLGLSRAVLEAILDAGVQPRLTVQTRSPLVRRDIDVFRRFDAVRVNMTIPTDCEDVRRRYEPRCPPIAARFQAIAQVRAAGVRIGVSVSPMLPMRDVASFAARLAWLDADEYVTQYLKPGRSLFAAGTSVQAVRKAREDGWGPGEYRRACAILRGVLGGRRPLLEGAQGYAPA